MISLFVPSTTYGDRRRSELVQPQPGRSSVRRKRGLAVAVEEAVEGETTASDDNWLLGEFESPTGERDTAALRADLQASATFDSSALWRDVLADGEG